MQKGNIGVTTENIFPIIKKFLYSDHEIFLRELVSNAVDAPLHSLRPRRVSPLRHRHQVWQRQHSTKLHGHHPSDDAVRAGAGTTSSALRHKQILFFITLISKCERRTICV